MLECVDDVQVCTVADFAVGDGVLLDAAASRWPRAKLVGCDIDPVPIRRARRRVAGASFVCIDFLDDVRREHSRKLAALKGTISVVLLNPPFSERGKKTFPAVVNGRDVRAGKALAFVCRALEYLSVGGVLVAILPTSCFSSERDEEAVAALKAGYVVKRIGPVLHQKFVGRTVGVGIFSFRARSVPKSTTAAELVLTANVKWPFKVIISRGSRLAASIEEAADGLEFVHTTHLKGNAVVPSLPRVSLRAADRLVDRAVLLPRVGRPDVRKVCELEGGRSVVVSDCLFVLETMPSGHERDVQREIVANWTRLSREYSGSCAPYLTLRRLAQFMLKLDFEVSVLSKTPIRGFLQDRPLSVTSRT